MNVVVGNVSSIHCFEPHQKIRNRVWLINNARRPCIAPRITSAKKVMYALFLSTKGLAIQVLIPKGRSMSEEQFLIKWKITFTALGDLP